MTRSGIILTTLAATMGRAASSQAFVPWSNTNGTATNFDWFGGGSDHGLFGSPVLVGGDVWVFFPNNFRAQSTDGGTSVVTDRMGTEVLMRPGLSLGRIEYPVTGQFWIGDSGRVEAVMDFTITDLDSLQVAHQLFTFSNSTPGLHDWTLPAVFDLASGRHDWTHFQWSVVLTLTAQSASFIDIGVHGGFKIIPAPAPSSAVLLCVALTAFGRRRR